MDQWGSASKKWPRMPRSECSHRLRPGLWKSRKDNRLGQAVCNGILWAEAREWQCPCGHGPRRDRKSYHEEADHIGLPTREGRQASPMFTHKLSPGSRRCLSTRQQRWFQCSIRLSNRPNSLCTVQSPASTSYMARLEQTRSCAESHPGKGSSDVSGPVISLNANCTPSLVIASRAIVVISTSDDRFFLLGQFVVSVIDKPRHSPRASCK